jgi:hypothetical protein
MPFAPFPFVLACPGASFRGCDSPPSICGMSVAPLTVAERVRAIEFVSSEVPARTAEEAAVAVDWGSDAILEATLCPPTVGNHPLVDPRFSGLLDLADVSSVVDRCAVGEVCRAVISCDAGDATAEPRFALDVGEVGDG